MGEIHFGENLDILSTFDDDSFELIYIDPPFNTGKSQRREQLKVHRDPDGDRVGFKGQRYSSVSMGARSYRDAFDDYLGYIEPRLREAKRLLTAKGSLFFHIDPRESHYCKVLLDDIFGRESFINEIIWSYDYGGRSKKRWSAKHDTIFWYAMDPGDYTFNFDAIDRIPYMAPGLVGAEKAARGKTPTDVWWNTIVSPTGKEKTGYPTQKPLTILERIIQVHSNAGDRVLDFFAGSGTTGEAAALHGREFVLIDANEEAMEVMVKRLGRFEPAVHGYAVERQDSEARLLAS